MANFKQIMMASAGGDSQWALMIKVGDDTEFTGTAPNDDETEYGVYVTTRGGGGSTNYVGFIQLDPDGGVIGPYKPLLTQQDGFQGRPVRYGRFGQWHMPRYLNYSTVNTFWGMNSSSTLGGANSATHSQTSSYNVDPYALDTQSSGQTGPRFYMGIDQASVGGGEKVNNVAGVWYSKGMKFTDSTTGKVEDIVKSPGDGAVYAVKVSNSQTVMVGKCPINTGVDWPEGGLKNGVAWQQGYSSAKMSYGFSTARTSTIAVKFGASSGALYVCGGNKMLKFNTNGDNTTGVLSLSLFWLINNSPQGNYSLGRIKFDNVNNKLYWICNQNATTGDYVTVVQMDDDGVVLGSAKINSNTTNYGEMRVTAGGKASDFFVTAEGDLVFGVTMRKTSGNSKRALLIKCKFDNLSSLAGITDSDGDEMIASVSNPSCSKSALSVPTPSYTGYMGNLNGMGMYLARITPSAFGPTLKNISL
tara:strand:- start:43 stop:1461 length:1419 start_codon:yes stop_codon:yes gene_type:complete